jgi:hypothetical protein
MRMQSANCRESQTGHWLPLDAEVANLWGFGKARGGEVPIAIKG